MTTIYFVRHAQPNYKNQDDRTRELTEQGLADSKKVTAFLLDKQIHGIYSSPFRRAVDTVKDFAHSAGLPIQPVEDFRERSIADNWRGVPAFPDFSRHQWENWDYHLPTGESLNQTQQRSVAALKKLLAACDGQNLVIGIHGTSLSMILAHYVPSFSFEQYQALLPRMPLILGFTFDGMQCIDIQHFDLQG